MKRNVRRYGCLLDSLTKDSLEGKAIDMPAMPKWDSLEGFTPIWAKPSNGPLVGMTVVVSLEEALELNT